MNLIDALEAAGVEFRNGSSDEEINVCCPFCLEEGELTLDERFRLGINIRTGQANCFNCGKRTGPGDYIFKEIERVLETGEIEAQQETRHTKKKEFKAIELPKDFHRIRHPDNFKDHWNKIAYRYVRKRQVSYDQIREKGIGYSVVGPWHHRIIFPIYRKAKLEGFVGRDFTDQQTPKYKNSLGAKSLYNLPKKPQKTAILVEGVFDTLAVEKGVSKLGIDSIGVLGHYLTNEQLELLSPYKRIILWFDPDEAGLEGTLKVVQKIPSDKVVRIVLPRMYTHNKTDKEPSELEVNEVTDRVAHAKVFTPELQMKLSSWSAFDE